MYKLRLYIAGQSPKTERSIEDLKVLLEDKLNGQYTLEVVDVLINTQLVENDKILATPTLVKLLPLPIRKVIGDLHSKDKVLIGLDLKPVN